MIADTRPLLSVRLNKFKFPPSEQQSWIWIIISHDIQPFKLSAWLHPFYQRFSDETLTSVAGIIVRAHIEKNTELSLDATCEESRVRGQDHCAVFTQVGSNHSQLQVNTSTQANNSVIVDRELGFSISTGIDPFADLNQFS